MLGGSVSPLGGAVVVIGPRPRLRGRRSHRAAKLTTKVITNSTRPLAISALTLSPVASAKVSAMFAAIVDGLVEEIRLKVTTPLAESTIATAIVSPSARPRPSMAAETMPERA